MCFVHIEGPTGGTARTSAVSAGGPYGKRGPAAPVPLVARTRTHAAHSLSRGRPHRQVAPPSLSSQTLLLKDFEHSNCVLYFYFHIVYYLTCRRVFAAWRAGLVQDARVELMCRGIYAQISSYSQAHREARIRSIRKPRDLSVREFHCEFRVEYCFPSESDATAASSNSPATVTSVSSAGGEEQESSRSFRHNLQPVYPLLALDDDSSDSKQQHAVTLLEAARLYERQHISNL